MLERAQPLQRGGRESVAEPLRAAVGLEAEVQAAEGPAEIFPASSRRARSVPKAGVLS
jgi:hypothetical protein